MIHISFKLILDAPTRRQAITSTNVAQYVRRYITSLGHIIEYRQKKMMDIIDNSVNQRPVILFLALTYWWVNTKKSDF